MNPSKDFVNQEHIGGILSQDLATCRSRLHHYIFGVRLVQRAAQEDQEAIDKSYGNIVLQLHWLWQAGTMYRTETAQLVLICRQLSEPVSPAVQKQPVAAVYGRVRQRIRPQPQPKTHHTHCPGLTEQPLHISIQGLIQQYLQGLDGEHHESANRPAYDLIYFSNTMMFLSKWLVFSSSSGPGHVPIAGF